MEEEEEEEEEEQPLSNKEQTHWGGWDFPFPSFTVFSGRAATGAEGRDALEHRCEAYRYVFSREVGESASAQHPAPHRTRHLAATAAAATAAADAATAA